MATYRYVGKDIQTSLNKSFDDADIRFSQIIYWIQVIANRIRLDQSEMTQSGLFVSTFSPIVVMKDEKGRQYIDLPANVMDLPNEKGIVYLTYNFETECCCSGATFAQVYFQPTYVGDAHRLYGDEYEKPTPKNPYFYRIGDKYNGISVNRLYLLGTECINVKDVEIAIKCTLDPASVCDLDDELPIPDERVEELMKSVLDLGRFVMMMPKERINQGADETSTNQPAPPSPAPPTEMREPENIE